jgi:hypothetical protein
MRAEFPQRADAEGKKVKPTFDERCRQALRVPLLSGFFPSAGKLKLRLPLQVEFAAAKNPHECGTLNAWLM